MLAMFIYFIFNPASGKKARSEEKMYKNDFNLKSNVIKMYTND